MVHDKVQSDLHRGSVFYDLNRNTPALLDVFSGEIRDGQGNILHKRLFVTQTSLDGKITIRQPTIFLDIALAPKGTIVPDYNGLPPREEAETILYNQAFIPLLEEMKTLRTKEIKTISEHMEISLNAIIDRAQLQFAELYAQKESGSEESGLDGRIRMLEDKLEDLNNRLEQRRNDLQKEEQCTISNIQHLGRAWILPHPERETPSVKKMISDPEIERIAVEAVTAYEEARGWKVQSVEDENRGFDLISRKLYAGDPETATEVRFIEVKGRSYVGEVALSMNEYKTAERLKTDYWLYVVFNCAAEPKIHLIQNPSRLGWKPVVKIEHYHVGAKEILKSGLQDA